MSWGINWGGGAWGGGDDDELVVTNFSVASAIATSSRTFAVTFTKAPSFQSTLIPTDASNLLNWMLIREDTSAQIGLITARATLDPLTIEFVILGSFANQYISYLVQAQNLIAVDSSVLVDPKFATFLGMPASRALAKQQRPLLDVWNPQVSGDQINGGLVVGSAGDYLHESGESLIKKLIIRRIITARDSFRHLFGQGYGAGIQPNELYTETDLVGLKTSIEQQILLEPEVRTVRVKLNLYSDNRLVVDVVAQLKTTNQQIAFSTPLNGPTALAA